jgi:predicted transcriptional regulator
LNAPPPTKKNVLDLDVRRRIVDAVREHPGLHLRGLADLLALPVSTLEYHCYQLARHGFLSTRQEGAYKAFYPEVGIDRRDKDILYVVRHEAPRRILAHLILHDGATPKDLKEALDMAGPTLSFHLKKLRDGGMTAEEAAGRTKLLHVTDPERVASVLVTYRRSFVDDAVDRFAEAWLDLHSPAIVQEAT